MKESKVPVEIQTHGTAVMRKWFEINNVIHLTTDTLLNWKLDNSS
jgi:hypothetical protein